MPFLLEQVSQQVSFLMHDSHPEVTVFLFHFCYLCRRPCFLVLMLNLHPYMPAAATQILECWACATPP